MKQIQSRDNSFYKQLKRLAESGRERRKTGLTLLDGVHLVTAWEDRFGPLKTLIVNDSALQGGEIAEHFGHRDLIVLSDALMRDLGIVDTPSGLLALAPMPEATMPVDLGQDLVLLDGVQDPGNLGTLMRTAVAAGVSQIALSAGCASAWSPKVLRAGQGAHFALAITEQADLAEIMQTYRGTTLVTCLEGASDLYETAWQGPLAWIFGAEGQGVSDALISLATQRVRIPMPGRIESLNVGAAAAVCLFEALRRRITAGKS